MLLGVYDYTVILTYFGMLAGFSGILQTMQGDLYKAMLCLMMAGICDMFDGKIACPTKVPVDVGNDILALVHHPAVSLLDCTLIVYPRKLLRDDDFIIGGFIVQLILVQPVCHIGHH